MNITAVVADDFTLWRSAAVTAVESDPGIKVVAEAESGSAAVAAVSQHRPDVILLDLHMPGESGLAVLPAVRAQSPGTRVVVLTASLKEEPFLSAMSAGASAYLTKDVSPRQLVQAIITVHGGGSVIAPSLAELLVRDYATAYNGQPRRVLSERENEMVRLVACGFTDVEIGRQMYVSQRTVQSHLSNIRDKLGLRRRTELARWAADHARI